MMEAMDRESIIAPWSDLPRELVERISKCFDSHIEILRIRAICNSWRSAIPLNFKIPKSLFPIKLPLPYTWLQSVKFKSQLHIFESTVYLFQLPHPPHTGWLVKIVKTLDGKLKILNPLTKRVIKFVSHNKLNLLDFRISQVSKSYHVQWLFNLNTKSHVFDGELDIIKKILVIWNDAANHFSLMAITIWHELLCFKSGNEKWTTLKDASSKIVDIITLKDTSCKIVDIIVYKGNFYVVDTYGETIMYDPSSFKVTNVSSTLKRLFSISFNEWGSKKRLVESGGELFLVDMYLDIDVAWRRPVPSPSRNNPMEIKIYRLDEEQHEWIAVHTLGDRIFFAGDDCCFSVSSSDFGDQCKGNCIYYENGDLIVDILGKLPSGGLTEEQKLRYKGLHGHHTGIFTLQDGKLGSLLSFLEYADIFWPPPSWLYSDEQTASSDTHN